MVYIETAIPASELAAYTADAPLFLAGNVLSLYNALPQWRVSGSWTSGTNIAASGAPTRWAFDGHGHLPSRLTLPSPVINDFSYIMDLSEGTNDARTFDSVVIWNHNFHLMTPTVTVYLEISDNSDFSGDVDLATWLILSATDYRLTSFSLNTAKRYTNARYVRLRVNTSAVGGFVTTPPFVGEIFLARRYQMSYPPELGVMPTGEISRDVTIFSPKSAASTTYVRNRGGRVFPSMMFRSGGADRNGHNQETAFRNFWSASRQGTQTFVYVPNPSTQPGLAVFCRADERFTIPQLGPLEHELSCSFSEKAPFYQTEIE